MPELHGSNADFLDGAFLLSGVDVFARAEGVLHHEKEAGDDILNQRLRAEGDGKAENAEAGEERRYVYTELGQYQ